MTIRIVLPEGDGVKSGCGTKFYTSSGEEIQGVCNATISLGVDEIITATLEVCVSEIVNSDGIVALLPPDEAKKVIEWARQSSTATAA